MGRTRYPREGVLNKMNRKIISDMINQPDNVLLVKFRSFTTIVCIFPKNITLLRKQIHKQIIGKYYPVSLEDEFIEVSLWIDSSWNRVKASYNDIAFIVIYNLPVLSTIHTVDEWNLVKDMIIDKVHDFGIKVREITIH